MIVGYSAVGWSENLDAFSLALKVEGLKPHTISCYVRDVQRLGESVDWIPPAKVTAKHVRRHVEALHRQVSAKTVHEAQLGIRRFFKYLVCNVKPSVFERHDYHKFFKYSLSFFARRFIAYKNQFARVVAILRAKMERLDTENTNFHIN